MDRDAATAGQWGEQENLSLRSSFAATLPSDHAHSHGRGSDDAVTASKGAGKLPAPLPLSVRTARRISVRQNGEASWPPRFACRIDYLTPKS